MKLTELLFERVETTPSGVRLIANPGAQQFEEILNRNIERFQRGDKNRDEAYVKGMLDKENNIFWIWDAFDATHAEVTEFLANAYKAGKIDYEGEGDLVPMLVSDMYDEVSFWAPDESFWNHPAVAVATRRVKSRYEQ